MGVDLDMSLVNSRRKENERCLVLVLVFSQFKAFIRGAIQICQKKYYVLYYVNNPRITFFKDILYFVYFLYICYKSLENVMMQ